jgi:hypothetical protein
MQLAGRQQQDTAAMDTAEEEILISMSPAQATSALAMSEGVPPNSHADCSPFALADTAPSAPIRPSASVKGERSSKRAKPRRTMWHNDGPDSTVSSLSILLDWLTTEGNYTRWRGGDKHSGETKTVLASQIAARISASGVGTIRKPKDIVTKISQLEQSFRDAIDFLSNTGAGITDETSLQQAIERRCPHYDTLKDVMADRASSQPLMTTEDALFQMEREDDLDLVSSMSDTAEASADHVLAKKRKGNDGAARRTPTIRSRSPSVASTLSEWTDLNSSLSREKAVDREAKTRRHAEKMAWEKEQFERTTSMEERRLAFAEEESRCRIILLHAQANKESIQAKREQVEMEKGTIQAERERLQYKLELARSRKRLRDEGIPEVEINELLPLTRD